MDISMVKFDEKGLVPAIVQEENGIKIFLNNTKVVSFSAVNSEGIYQILRREGWNA